MRLNSEWRGDFAPLPNGSETLPRFPVGERILLSLLCLGDTSRRSRWTLTMAKVPDFAGVLCEGEFADLLRKLPFVEEVVRQQCRECRAYLREGNSRRTRCDPCRERRWKKAMVCEGFPDYRITPGVIRLFWTKVTRNGRERCWHWTGYMEGGYPRLCTGGPVFTAARVSYELHYGPIPFRFIVVRRCSEV